MHIGSKEFLYTATGARRFAAKWAFAGWLCGLLQGAVAVLLWMLWIGGGA
jgi:hypothetical protein